MSIPVQKNQIIRMDIEGLGDSGEGIGRVDGFTVFVQGGIPGDHLSVEIIKVKKQYAMGVLKQVIRPSDARRKPSCPYAKKCGGCQMQHVNYVDQLTFKKKAVESAVTRIGKLEGVPVHEVLGMDDPYCYRNKGQYPVALGHKDKVDLGFYRQRSHDVVDVEVCELQHLSANAVARVIRHWAKDNKITIYDEKKHKGLLRHVLVRTAHGSGAVMVVLVTKGTQVPSTNDLIKRLQEAVPGVASLIQNINTSKGNRVLGFENVTLWGADKIEDNIGDLTFEISPLSFFQVNPVQTEVLYGKALEYAALTGEETVVDLYCGIGTISLFLAQKAKKVVGVEIIEDAILDARKNAQANGIENAEFHVGAAEEVIPKLYEEGLQADVVVVDPPRKGCDEIVLKTIGKMRPERVVYVSCKASTMARDLRLLEDMGYKTQEVQPVDMFPWTYHVETIVALYKKD